MFIPECGGGDGDGGGDYTPISSSSSIGGGGDIDMISPVTTTPTPITTSSSGGGNIGSNSIKTIPSLQEWLKTAHVVNTTTAGGCDKCNGSGNGGISSTTTITNGSGGSVKDIINMSSSEMESR